MFPDVNVTTDHPTCSIRLVLHEPFTNQHADSHEEPRFTRKCSFFALTLRCCFSSVLCFIFSAQLSRKAHRNGSGSAVATRSKDWRGCPMHRAVDVTVTIRTTHDEVFCLQVPLERSEPGDGMASADRFEALRRSAQNRSRSSSVSFGSTSLGSSSCRGRPSRRDANYTYKL